MIDIHSRSAYPASALSNFAAHRFVVDGTPCASMEGLLQSLKFPDPADQVRVCALSGPKAKKAGRSAPDWTATQTLHWAGAILDRRGDDYQALLDRAFAALAGNADFARALLATGDVELAHSAGHDDPTATVLTAAELLDRLKALRAGLAAAVPSARMDDRRLVKVSKYLAKHLRHRPERIGLHLDPAGWVPVEDLLAACNGHSMTLTRAELDEVVARNDKQRFEIATVEGAVRIRAVQGHSVDVVLGHTVTDPPAVLYHGTVGGSLDGIFTDGLTRQSRHHVHLSPDVETARTVGRRRGRPVVLAVDAAGMAADGHTFTVAPNGVWLVDHVPPDRITVVG